MKSKIERLIKHYEENPRTEEDLEIVAVLRELKIVYCAARDVIQAKNYQSSKAAYAELYDLFKGNSK